MTDERYSDKEDLTRATDRSVRTHAKKRVGRRGVEAVGVWGGSERMPDRIAIPIVPEGGSVESWGKRKRGYTAAEDTECHGSGGRHSGWR